MRLQGTGLHVAIVMDGNGRWAEARGRPRSAGHAAGAGALRRTVRTAARLGIGTLTVYAFSSDNWRRPAAEVRHLMRLFRRYLGSEAARCEGEGIRVSVIGRRDRLDPAVVHAIQETETRTRGGRRLHLQVAIDYSGRDAILGAVRSLAASRPEPLERTGVESASGEPVDVERFEAHLARALHAPAPLPPVDLLIRTGGDQRLSDFLPWECAYAELIFTPVPWPDFGGPDLERALETFHLRERRFGGLSTSLLPRATEAHAHAD